MMKKSRALRAPWTAEDDDRLAAWAKSGEPLGNVAEQLGRSISAIRNRLYKLEISSASGGQRNKKFANHYERQFMEYLRGGRWIDEKALPPSRPLISGLLSRGWIERQIHFQKAGYFYRITEAGLAGLKAPMPTKAGSTKRK